MVLSLIVRKFKHKGTLSKYKVTLWIKTQSLIIPFVILCESFGLLCGKRKNKPKRDSKEYKCSPGNMDPK